MILYHLMGVQDIPREASLHWKVVERWSEQPGGYHRLVLESDTAAEECRSGRAKYIVFPQTYMAKQEIISGATRLYTNEMDRDWYLRSMLDRVVIDCELLRETKKLIFRTTSTSKYYASINKYPYSLMAYPGDQFLYDLTYILSATISLFVAGVGTLVLYAMGLKNFKLLGLGAAIATLMFGHVPGYFLQIHVSMAHLLQMIGTFFMAYFYTVDKIHFVSSKHFRNVFVLFVFFSVIAAFNFPNTNQFLMLAVANATTIFGILYAVLNFKLEKEVRINLFIVLLIAHFDMYRAQAYREGYINLSVLVIVVVTLEIVNIFTNIYRSALKAKKIEGNLESERKLFHKVNEANELLKEIIHDLKAPITSINFLSQAREIKANQVLLIADRFNKVLSKLYADSSKSMASWMSIKLLMSITLEVCAEMGSLFKKINIVEPEDKSGDIFLFREDYKNALAELIMNAFKAYGDQSINAEICVKVENLEKEVNVYVIDLAGGVDDNMLKNISQKGFTTNSSGLGLWMIKKKLSEVNGNLLLGNKNGGFEVCMKYLKRNNSNLSHD